MAEALDRQPLESRTLPPPQKMQCCTSPLSATGTRQQRTEVLVQAKNIQCIIMHAGTWMTVAVPGKGS